MTIPEAVVAAAHKRNIRHCFGVPGSGALMDLIDAGRKLDIEFISMANEASAAIAAAYYGYLRGSAGLALAIKGPGAGNLVSGAINAYFERKPVVCITESLSKTVTLSEIGQLLDQQSLFRGFAKKVASLAEPNAIKTIDNAFETAAGARPGPVLLDLPGDLAMALADGGIASKNNDLSRSIELNSIRKAAATIKKMQNPVIIAGGDLFRAGALTELTALFERLRAAVLVTIDARGILTEDHPRFAAVFAGIQAPGTLANQILAQADGVVLLGVDPLTAEAPWESNLPTVEFSADCDYETLSPSPVQRVNGPLQDTIGSLISMIPETNKRGFSLKLISRLKNDTAAKFLRSNKALFAIQDVITIIREKLPINGLLFSESAIFVLMLEYLWRVYKPDTFFGSAGGRTMGLMLPAILGAKLAQPETPMIGLGGDGSTLMRLGELESFSRTGIAVPLVVINDHAYGTIKARQRYRGFTPYSLDLHPVDYAQVARACGLQGVAVKTPDEFAAVIDEAMHARTSTLIDVRIDQEPYWNSFVPTTGVL